MAPERAAAIEGSRHASVDHLRAGVLRGGSLTCRTARGKGAEDWVRAGAGWSVGAAE